MNGIKAVEIEINSQCNRACVYCPNVSEKRDEIGEMKLEVFHKILAELKKIKYKGRVSFSFYNEPLLCSKLNDYTKLLKTTLPETTLVLYTNGTLLTHERLLELIGYGVDRFIVTKHKDEENYLFDQTIQELDEDIIKNHITYQSYTDLKMTNRGGLLPEIKKNVPHVNLPCVIPLHMITFTNQGTLVPCFEDYHQVNAMGNIMDTSLSELWNSQKYKEFRQKLLLGFRRDFAVCNQCNRVEMIDIH